MYATFYLKIQLILNWENPHRFLKSSQLEPFVGFFLVSDRY
ncbi:hypothetical protein [Cuspidothrix issatschenkoi]|nr:hypothetical protein [Cuspidothrix issatschenkoi]